MLLHATENTGNSSTTNVRVRIFNQVFQRKTLVINMMNVDGRTGGRRGISFPEHNSATVKTF